MRRTIACFVFFLYAAAGSVSGDDCGTIDRTEATIEKGTAPIPGKVLLEPCAGPGWPGEWPTHGASHSGDGRLIANWAWMELSLLGEAHPTDVTATLPGGRYQFGDNFTVPAGVTLTYTGAVTIVVWNRANIHGTIRTTAPDSRIRICTGLEFTIEGSEFKPAKIEALGERSWIEIGSRSQVTGKFRSEIRCEHGDILISGADTADGTSGVHLTSTDVRAPNGTVEVSAKKNVALQKGYYEGGGGGLLIRSTWNEVELSDLVMDAGDSERGIDVRGWNGVRVSGYADLFTRTAPIVLNSYGGTLQLADVYSIYSDSGSQLYKGGSSVELLGETVIASNSGNIEVISGVSGIDISAREMTSVSGEIRILTEGNMSLSGDALIHSDAGRILIDCWSLRMSDRVHLGRGSHQFAPIEVRCDWINATRLLPEGGIHGSRVDLVCTDTYINSTRLGSGFFRAEEGAVRISCRGDLSGHGQVQARDGIHVDVGGNIDLSGAELTTHDRTIGASGPIVLRAWGGGESHIDIADAALATGDSPTESGGIQILVGMLERPSAWILPKTVTVKEDAKDPTRARITVTGDCDLGTKTVNLTSSAELTVGGLSIPMSGLAPNTAGTKFSLKSESLVLTIAPSKKGTSRGKFKLVYTGDLTGKVDTAGDLTVRYVGDGIDATGTVRLTGGKFKLRKVAGNLIEPGLWVSKAKASVRGGGKDSLSLVLGLATDGTVPAAAEDVTVTFGTGLPVTVPAASFVRKGDRYEFRGDLDGITRIVVDWAKQTVKVTGQNLDLSSIPEGPSSMAIGVAIGTDARTTGVKMVRAGRKLRY